MGVARSVWNLSPPALLAWLYALTRRQHLQAEQVTAWAGDHVDCEFIREFREREEWQPYHPHTLLVRNSGTHPVRSVTVHLPGMSSEITGESTEAYYWIGDVPPDTTRTTTGSWSVRCASRWASWCASPR